MKILLAGALAALTVTGAFAQAMPNANRTPVPSASGTMPNANRTTEGTNGTVMPNANGTNEPGGTVNPNGTTNPITPPTQCAPGQFDGVRAAAQLPQPAAGFAMPVADRAALKTQRSARCRRQRPSARAALTARD